MRWFYFTDNAMSEKKLSSLILMNNGRGSIKETMQKDECPMYVSVGQSERIMRMTD